MSPCGPSARAKRPRLRSRQRRMPSSGAKSRSFSADLQPRRCESSTVAPSSRTTRLLFAPSQRLMAHLSGAPRSIPHLSPKSWPQPPDPRGSRKRREGEPMEQNELLAYLRSQRLGVLGTLSPPGEPQAALVGYAVTPDFELLFDTLRTTRKYRNIIATPLVSFTVGNTAGHGDERTVQYEGIAEELSGWPLERLRPVYFATWPDGVE